MKILIIGYGSIGKRHHDVIRNLQDFHTVDIVTNRKIENTITFKSLGDIIDIKNYDYFIISSETSKHYEQLKYVCSLVENKIILVEKPLYDKTCEDIKTSNKIYTAYNLRFHPVIEKLKDLLQNEEIYYANIICGQYLPSWRPERDYRTSYSADINKGGGVLRDLSHELDYAIWLFGDINRIQSINTKISDLEISSDDIFTAIGVTSKKIVINLSIDYISKHIMRKILIHTKNYTIQADIINNIITLNDKNQNQNTIKVEKYERNYTYSKMHQSILNSKPSIVCSFEEGKKITNLINNIRYKDI